MTLLQKDYAKSPPKLKLPVLETMLFAVCLEDNPWDKAEAGYQNLLKSYFDMNEIRVSSVGELEATFSGLKNADWKGLRVRSILRFVFESTYSFDFEKLARLTLESAQKRLRKIDYLSPFVTNFTLQAVLGSHVVCLDDSSHRAAVHLGIVPPESSLDDACEFLKGGLKKAEAFNFAYLLRCLATDPKFEERLTDEPDEDEEFDVLRVEQRLAALKAPRRKKKPAKKALAKDTKPSPVSTTKAASATGKETKKTSSGSKTGGGKSSATVASGKATAKKAPAKKASAGKTSARKSTAPKSPVKKKK